MLSGALSLTALCAAQSVTPAPTASCNYCYLAPGYTDVSSANKEYVLFTAYSMTSAFTQNGFCFTNSGASSALPTPYSVAKPASATANPTQFSSALASWFVDALKVPDWGVCGADGSLVVHLAGAETTQTVNVAVPTVLGAISRTSSLPSASTSAGGLVVTPSSHGTEASGGLSAGAKAAVGVMVAVVVLGLLVLGLVLFSRYGARKHREAMMKEMAELKLGVEDTEKGSERRL